LHDKAVRTGPAEPGVFEASDFTYNAEARRCVCPAGKTLNRNGHRA
jgi:hypothetical protein